MAAPTQEYPPWLTPVPHTIFGPNGAPLSTSTTILYLPLTYYGPSIPLGAEWTYGGLTPPVSTSTVIISTTATPSSSSSSTSTATPTSTSRASSLSLSTPPGSPTSIPPPPPAIPPRSQHGELTHGQLIGVIVGAVIGAVVIFIALFVCFLLFKNRQRRQRVRFSNLPIDPDYIVVDSEDARAPGDGSPRHSGEERDTLLQSHRTPPTDPRSSPRYQKVGQQNIPSTSTQQPAAGPLSQHVPGELSARSGVPRVPVPPVESRSSKHSGNSGSSTEMSSLGSIVQNSRLSTLSPLAEEQREFERAVATAAATHFRGPILTQEELRRVEEETHQELDTKEEHSSGNGSDLSALSPPPRTVDPENIPPRLVLSSGNGQTSAQIQTVLVPSIPSNLKPHGSYVSSNRSSVPFDPEDVTLVTAHRVKPLDWGVRAAPYYYSPLSERQGNSNGNSNVSGGIAAGLLSSLSSKLSWFRNVDAHPTSGSSRRRSETPKDLRFSDKDVEAGKALLSPTVFDLSDAQSPTWTYHDRPLSPHQQQIEPQSMTRLRGPNVVFGLNPDGSRPISAVSGRSGGSSAGGTAYYDAYSTLPNTPILAPPPRAMTPAPGSLAAQVSKDSWRLPSPLSISVSAPSLRPDVQQAQQVSGPPAEFGGRYTDAPPAYDENDTIAREHTRDLASGTGHLDILDLPAPSALLTFKNVATSPVIGDVVNAPPMGLVASTSTAFTNTNTTSMPTLFTRTEGTISTATSQSSMKDSSHETTDRKDGAGAGGTAGAETKKSFSDTVDGRGNNAMNNNTQMPREQPSPSDLGDVTMKEAKSWSKDSATINISGGPGGRTSYYYDASSILQSDSRGTSRTNITGTTLAVGEETAAEISIDVLEDEPPAPGEGWRSLAGAIGGGSGAAVLDGAERRHTFGLAHQQAYVQQQRYRHQGLALAELGSLQSMRSHLSPASSNRSTGSAPASRRDMSGSLGSNSSRPSAQHSLSHSGSISSYDGGRRRYPSGQASSSLRFSAYTYSSREGLSGAATGGPISPALSAFGARVKQQGSAEMPRNLTPLSEQYAVESGSSYFTAPSTFSRRSVSGITQDPDLSGTFRSAATGGVVARMASIEQEVDVVDMAQAEMHPNGGQEFGMLSPRSQSSQLDTSLRLSSAPWAAGLDPNWMPL
ncbi:hypothetical protein AX17_006511 [Amanita inopinata Kibby_2008]|nr:hypothetical protein AX17_006511 [Amanita inopinata Kibby_2008]